MLLQQADSKRLEAWQIELLEAVGRQRLLEEQARRREPTAS